ncbi:hypothetical protein [Nocardioides houyundeii]|uniref:hypothetical protein n=1 Tax=Nocardioides houyundeii TaxID=2045452 RepID=UPI000C761405|nr:hypothetical protein [Nocardioides houyundeii]
MKVRTVNLSTSAALAAVALSVPASAQAEPRDIHVVDQQFQVLDATISDVIVTFSQGVAADVTYTVTVTGCDRVVTTESFAGAGATSRYDGFTVSERMDPDDVGPAVGYRVTFSDPTMPVLAGQVPTPSDYPRDCDDAWQDGPATVVPASYIAAWSTKAPGTPRRAKVGKTLRVTKTRLNPLEGPVIGGSVTEPRMIAYKWVVGGKVVKQGLKAKVRPGWKGKRVLLRVIVTAPSHKPRVKHISFKRVS